MRILTYGSFDCLHYGHINLLNRAAAMGDQLFVGLSTDSFQLVKGKSPCRLDWEERFRLLTSLKVVSFIFPETSWEQKSTDIAKYNIDMLVMGDDWNFDNLQVPFIALPRTSSVSSTIIRNGA